MAISFVVVFCRKNTINKFFRYVRHFLRFQLIYRPSAKFPSGRFKFFNAKMHKTQRRKEMENEISYKIIGAAIEVHRTLGGPGLLEAVYESSLCHELQLMGLQIQTQLSIPVKYKNVVVRDPLCIDILVEKRR